MTSFDVTERSIEELQAAQTQGIVSAHGLTLAYLQRIEDLDQRGPALNAIVRINPHALRQAAALDLERRGGSVRGPLHGIPILVKDNFETIDMPTSGGSVVLKNFHPRNDAFQVRRLREAGAVIIGKTTMHELAVGVTNASSLSGYTRNPYALDRVPGGSSGGAGAAIAASFAAAGMGSDTAGSLRIPAANQSLVALRVSSGLSSRSGVTPLSMTQDVAGPLARSVTDLAIMLDATVGVDRDDPSTVNADQHIPSSYRDMLRTDSIEGLSIGVLRDLFGTMPEDEEVSSVINRALARFSAHGAHLHELGVPQLEELIQSSSVIGHEFKFDFADYLQRYPYAPVHSLAQLLKCNQHHVAVDEVLRKRDEAVARDSIESRSAFAARDRLRNVVLNEMQRAAVDVLVYPVMRRKAAFIGQGQSGVNSQLCAGTGLPAIAIPAGFTDDGVPVGMEFLGKQYTEQTLLNLAFSWEKIEKIRRMPGYAFSTKSIV